MATSILNHAFQSSPVIYMCKLLKTSIRFVLLTFYFTSCFCLPLPFLPNQAVLHKVQLSKLVQGATGCEAQAGYRHLPREHSTHITVCSFLSEMKFLVPLFLFPYYCFLIIPLLLLFIPFIQFSLYSLTIIILFPYYYRFSLVIIFSYSLIIIVFSYSSKWSRSFVPNGAVQVLWYIKPHLILNQSDLSKPG